MIKKVIYIFIFGIIILYGNESNEGGNADEKMCLDLYDFLIKHDFKDNISKAPTKNEMSLIDGTKSMLLEENGYYSQGVTIVDADNDDKKDAVLWSVGIGLDRSWEIELFSIVSQKNGTKKKLIHKVSFDSSGMLEDPRFIHYKNKNYLLAMYDYRYNNELTISEIKASREQYQLKTLCKIQRTLKTESQCNHLACLQLKNMIENPKTNELFAKFEWPNKTMGEIGLSVYFPYQIHPVDLDNSNQPTWIWHLGRDGKYQPDDWLYIGIGKDQPKADFEQQLSNERKVLSGIQHERLRRVLSEQSKVLSHTLHRQILLPKEGEFFLFKTDENKTYWAWDFGQPPFGEEIHIMYSDENKTEYIGEVKIIKSTPNLVPCKENCIEKLDHFIF